MRKIVVLLSVFISVITVQAQQINDLNAEVREAKNYHAISVSNAFDVYLSQGTEEGVAVSASSTKDRDMISVEVKEGTLYIGLGKGWKWSHGNKKLKAYISFKEMDKLTVSGACDVFIKGVIKGDALAIHQSGASDVKGKVEVNKLSVDLSGASDITITGTATQVSVEASGASDFKGYDLIADVCNAKASGASDIRITVNKELSAQASGASDVKYKGGGVIRDIKSSGASSVSKG
jgi:Putative auto-transporter adhesin, head GIN domain